jgi:hypothetical protein
MNNKQLLKLLQHTNLRNELVEYRLKQVSALLTVLYDLISSSNYDVHTVTILQIAIDIATKEIVIKE